MFPYKNETSLNGRTDYKCQTCAKSFFSKINLKRHINVIHKGHKDFKCDLCGKSFSEKGKLKRHNYTVHEGHKDHNCDSCGKLFSTASILRNHINQVHDDTKVHQCDSCSESFSKSRKLKIHINTVHKGHKGHKCKLCAQSFTQSGYLKVHIHTIHEGHKDHKCDCCGKSFSQAANLKEHMHRMHILGLGQKDQFYKCNSCKESFSTLEQLKKHSNKFHDEPNGQIVKTVIEETTSKHKMIKTVDPENNQHQLISQELENDLPNINEKNESNSGTNCDLLISEDHQGDLPGRDPKKSHNFSNISMDLSNDTLDTTSTDEPEIIDFITNEEMKMKGKSGKSPVSGSNNTTKFDHKCLVCGKIFYNQNILEKHINKIHVGLKQYKCKYCGKSFSCAHSLKKHINRIHMIHKDFKCESCGNAFNDFSSLNIHIDLNMDCIKKYEMVEIQLPTNILTNEELITLNHDDQSEDQKCQNIFPDFSDEFFEIYIKIDPKDTFSDDLDSQLLEMRSKSIHDKILIVDEEKNENT